MATAGELIVSIVGDMEGLKKTFQGVQTEIGNLSKNLGDVGKNLSETGSKMTTGITAPILAVGAGIGVTASKAIDFDTQVRRIGTMLPGITEEGFNKIKQQSLDLSTQFGSDTASINDAMYQALSSGIPEDNIFEFMQTSEKLAIGGATDVLTSVDGLTSVVNSYGASQINASHAADVMFQGTKLGKSTIEELSKYMADVVPIAAANKVSFEDVNASLATMTIQGTRTPVAITQLKNIILELSNDTTGAAQAFKQISGESFTDFIAKGGTVGEAVQMMSKSVGEYIPTVKDMNKFTKEFDDPASQMSQRFNELTGKSFQEFIKGGGSVQQAMKIMGVEGDKTTKTVTDFFSSVDAKTGVLQLAGEGAKLYTTNITEMGKANGSTEQAFKTMSEGLGTQTNIMKEKFNALLITLGNQFLPVLKDTIVPFVTNTLIPGLEKMIPVVVSIMTAFGNLSPTLQLIIFGLIGLIAAIGPILVIIGSVASGLGALAGIFAAGGALATAGTIISGLIAGIAALGAPILILIGVVALLAAAWANDWGGIREKAAAIWDWITTTAADLYNKLEYVYHAIIMSQATLRDNFQTLWDLIATIFSTVFDTIINLVTSWYNTISTQFNEVLAFISNTFSSVYTTITMVFDNAFTYIVTVITNIYDSINTTFNNVLTTITTVFQNIYAAIQTAFTNVYNFLVTIATNIYNAEVTGFNLVLTAITTIFNTIYTTIQTVFTNVYNSVSTIAKNIYNTINTEFNNALNTAKTVFNNIYTAIQTAFTNAYNSVSTIAKNIYNTINTEFNNALNTARTVFNNIYTAIQSAFNNAYNTVVTIATNIYNSINNKFNDALTAAKTIFNNIYTAINTKIGDAKTAVETGVTNMYNAINNKVTDFYNAGKALVQNLIDGINSKISDLETAASKLASKAASYLPMHSPALIGPLSSLPHWEDFFENPIKKSISKSQGTVEEGLKKITQIVNNPTTAAPVSNSYADTITIGPNNISSPLDLQDLIDKLVTYQAQQRRARGVFV